MGLGRVLGHAMMGYGKGASLVAADDMEARRAEALENLRAENDAKARQETADLNDRNNARQTARETDSSIVREKVGAEIQAERDARLHTYDQESARLASQLRQTESAASLRLADQLDRAAKAGEVQGIEIDGKTGEKVIVYRDGTTKPTGIQATERELTHSGYGGGGAPSMLDQARLAQGLGGKPAPAPQPTTRPNAQQSSQKTYTMADAQATAKKHNVPLEEVHRRMREAGYKLAGQ